MPDFLSFSKLLNPHSNSDDIQCGWSERTDKLGLRPDLGSAVWQVCLDDRLQLLQPSIASRQVPLRCEDAHGVQHQASLFKVPKKLSKNLNNHKKIWPKCPKKLRVRVARMALTPMENGILEML